MPDEQRKVGGAHLPARKRLAQGKTGSELVGSQTDHDQTRTRTFLEKAAQAEIPVQVLGLLDAEPADRALRGQTVAQTVDLNPLDEQRVPDQKHGGTAVWSKGMERACDLVFALLSPLDPTETGED